MLNSVNNSLPASVPDLETAPSYVMARDELAGRQIVVVKDCKTNDPVTETKLAEKVASKLLLIP